MAGERYVLLGLAPPRATWFRAVAQWATAGSIPVEFLKCVSGEELRSRLASGRAFSALLVDAGLAVLDRDLVDDARSAGCPVIAISDGRARDWEALGVAAVLPADLDPKDLLDGLGATAEMIGRGDAVPGDAGEPITAWRGQVAMVCGPGGTGASTVAIALAQGLADDVRHGGLVVLADLALHGEQAMLHDARDVVPGVQELVDAHRVTRPSAEEVRSLTFSDAARGYHLLLGLRRARAWATIRPRSFEAAFDSLRRTHRIVVCDTDAELEGEAEGGSMDVEERHVMARTAAAQADVVFAVGRPGMKGMHALVRVLAELLVFGVPPERIVPVINQAPRQQRNRAELAATLAELLPRQHAALASPIFLPEKRVDDLLRDAVRLPTALTSPLAGAFRAVIERTPVTGREPVAPKRVIPGSLGLRAEFDEEEAEGTGTEAAAG